MRDSVGIQRQSGKEQRYLRDCQGAPSIASAIPKMPFLDSKIACTNQTLNTEPILQRIRLQLQLQSHPNLDDSLGVTSCLVLSRLVSSRLSLSLSSPFRASVASIAQSSERTHRTSSSVCFFFLIVAGFQQCLCLTSTKSSF